jgi:aryl-alcohol dehydrogenase-like predicted oxidoreductase
LNVETIDLYQIHWPIPDNQIEEAFEVMARAQTAGKIRYLGVSNFSVEQMERVGAIAEITSLQPPYSLVFPDVGKEILPYCLENQIGVINYSPMASGLLSGKMSKERIDNLDKEDWRRKADHFTGSRLERNLALADLLKEIGNRHQSTAGEVAIAWTLVNPAVTAAIVGMRSPDQVGGVIKAGEIQLSEKDLKEIADFVEKNP